MKKLLSMLLLVGLCCGALIGCGGKRQDVTKLPHNAELSLSDTKDVIMEEDGVVADGSGESFGTYKKEENVTLANKEYTVGYEFETNGEIQWVAYTTGEATLEESQEYVDSVYGDLETGENGEYIIKCDGKTWTARCLESASPIIFIVRDETLD